MTAAKPESLKDSTMDNDAVGPEQSSESGLIRIILADSQAIYRVGMRKIFALEDDIRVVAQVDTLSNLDAAIQRFPTDLVILEGSLINGATDAVPNLVRKAPQVKIIIQAVASDESNTVELYRRGVRGIIPRSISPDLLVKCVRKIAEGRNLDRQSVCELGDRSVPLAGHRTYQSAHAAPSLAEGTGDHHMHYAGQA